MEAPKALKTRLTITEGMTTEQVRKEGNAAQKAAICIFDKDANGVFDKEEASLFDSMRIALHKDGTANLYKNNELEDSVDLKKAQADYDAKIAYEKESMAKYEAIMNKISKPLTFYGINPKTAEWVGIDDVSVKTINGQKTLVLTSKKEQYQLELPLDKDFDPSKIEMYRAEDITNVHFENIKGTLRTTGEKIPALHLQIQM